MIIIKISILYFIQIRHTDDFPSTGTRLVVITNAVVSTQSDDGSCKFYRYSRHEYAQSLGMASNNV